MAIDKILDNDSIPWALSPYCSMQIENDRILVYSGDFSLQYMGITSTITGVISYSLVNGMQLEFSGSCKNCDYPLFGDDLSIQISTPNGQKGEGLLYRMTSNADEVSVRGILNYLSAEPVECTRWHWSFLNMEKFIGDSIQRISSKGSSVSLDRLSFKCHDGTMIIMDNLPGDSANYYQSHLSHQCELIPADGKAISIDVADKYILAFSQFISFVVGRYHGPILICGECADGHHYMYHYSRNDNSKVGVSGWLPFPNDKDIEKLWPVFESIWNGKDRDKADILSTVIHWYMEANMNSGKMEGAYIMAITGIEMMWNVLLPHKKENRNNDCMKLFECLFKTKLHKESANQKFQVLLNMMRYNPSSDASALIQCRNMLVHYDCRNRKKYQRLTRDQKHDRLEKALNILALTILYWLGYDGHFADRTNSNKWRGASTIMVPWVEQ